MKRRNDPIPVPETVSESELMRRFQAMNRHQRRALVVQTGRLVKERQAKAAKALARFQVKAERGDLAGQSALLPMPTPAAHAPGEE